MKEQLLKDLRHYSGLFLYTTSIARGDIDVAIGNADKDLSEDFDKLVKTKLNWYFLGKLQLAMVSLQPYVGDKEVDDCLAETRHLINYAGGHIVAGNGFCLFYNDKGYTDFPPLPVEEALKFQNDLMEFFRSNLNSEKDWANIHCSVCVMNYVYGCLKWMALLCHIKSHIERGMIDSKFRSAIDVLIEDVVSRYPEYISSVKTSEDFSYIYEDEYIHRVLQPWSELVSAILDKNPNWRREAYFKTLDTYLPDAIDNEIDLLNKVVQGMGMA